MALVGTGIKVVGATAIVAILSVVVVTHNLMTEGHAGFVRVYGIGAAAGLAVSIAAAALMKRRAAHLRAKNLLLTLGALFGGVALLSTQSISVPLVGEKATDTGMLILNYALGYFMVGVAIDARRVLRAKKLKQRGQ